MKKLIVLLTIIGAMFAFVGCSKQIELEDAFANNARIKSVAYDLSMKADLKSEVDEDGYKLTSDIKGEIRLEGKSKKKDGQSLNYTNVKLSSGGISVEVPIYIAVKEGDIWDFETFIGIPGIFNEMVGDIGYDTVFLSGKDLKKYLEENNGQEIIDQIEKQSNNKDNKKETPETKKLGEDFSKHFLSYIEKNKEEIKSFERMDKKSANANGVYTIKLTKDDFKDLFIQFVENEEYYKDLKKAVEASNNMAGIGMTYHEEGGEYFPSAEEIVTNINETFSDIAQLDVTAKFVIEDKFVTKMNVLLEVSSLGDAVSTLSFDLKLSDINKDFEIKFPDKEDEKTANLIDLAKEMMGGMLNPYPDDYFDYYEDGEGFVYSDDMDFGDFVVDSSEANVQINEDGSVTITYGEFEKSEDN